MTKRRPITQLPPIHRTTALERFFGSTVDHLFQPGTAEPVSGYIGRVPSYDNPVTDFYKPEPTADRTKYQLEAAMASDVDGEVVSILFYNDLISRLNATGAITTNPARLFQSEYWAWAPPIDIDKINNFRQYYWSGNNVPALELTLPGMEIPAIYRGNGLDKSFALPRSLPCMRILDEYQTSVIDAAPQVMVNGSLVACTFDFEKITLATAPAADALVEVYRYGNIGDGIRMDFSYPILFTTGLEFDENTDIHVYINGRETHDFTRVDDKRISLDTPAPANTIVTVTAFNSIEALCTGKPTFHIANLNNHDVPDMIEGLKVRLIDPTTYFVGFDIKPYDTFKWDEITETDFFVEGVGTSIHLVKATQYGAIDPQYVVMSRRDPANSYWSRINRWVMGEALDWFNGRTSLNQASRPICEYIPGLKLWDYGVTRAPDADAIFGITRDWNIGSGFTTFEVFDDTGRKLTAGDKILFGNVGDNNYNNKMFIWPVTDNLASPGDLVLIDLATVNEGDVVQYTASTAEYRFDNDEWILCAPIRDFPLFDLFDNDGVSLGDEAQYPESTFAGSRIFCYQVGTGINDPKLGFPAKYDTYGQIMFENDMYTHTYSWRNGDFIGFSYYKVGQDYENQWYKASGVLPAPGSRDDVVVPYNLQANPNFGTPQFISRNNWFAHFASIEENQNGFTGHAYSTNNWQEISHDLSKGTQIIQSRSPMLKLMLLLGENGFDLPRAINFASSEFVRLKLKIRQKINEGLKMGTYVAGFDATAAVKTILKILTANKTAEFAFFLSPIGGDTFFIPPTPATMGILPMYRPEIITENEEQYILGHDGSKSASVDSITDAIILAFENMIFESREEKAYKPEGFPILNEFDLLGGKWRAGSYTVEETNAIQQFAFEDWVRTNNIDYQQNSTYDEENPFTWNYSSIPSFDGGVLPGGWRGIYRYYFDTETPHTTPWEMLGFAQMPDWWEDEYGSAPYGRTRQVWSDLAVGRILNGDRAGIDTRFARPNLMNFLPVSEDGLLLDPIEARIVERGPTVQFAKESWVFGDCGPIEALWRRSSAYGYAKALTFFLMRPAQFVEDYWDTDQRALIHDNQWIDIPTNDRAANSEYVIHGELVDGVPKISMGIQNWLVEHMIHQGQSPDTLGILVRGLDVRLAHKMAGYTTPDRMHISAESFGIIPAEDINILLYQSPGLSVDSYSGIIVEQLQTSRWRVIGYNALDPYFTVRPSDRGGRKQNLTVNPLDDRIVNPWGSNIYYKQDMYVLYKGYVYRALRNHLSTDTFEEAYWELDDSGVANNERLYRYVDWDGAIERVPYATIFHTRQEVIEFLVSYQRDLEGRGFTFEDAAWDDSVTKFINWSRVPWEEGMFLTLSPAARTLEYNTAQGYILNIENPLTSSGIINRTGHVIDSRNTKVDRFDGQLVITAVSVDDIYGVSLRKAEIEHALVFSNRTIFGDIIFDPVFNVRQERLKMSARMTTDWTGRYDAPGFIISSEGKILDNFAKSSEDIRYMFDIELADNTVLRDHARHVIGFEKRPYLSELLLNETQQFELYQGMIQQKGALGSLDKIMRSKAVEGNRDIKFLEEWAFKLSDFGAYEPRGYVELAVNQNDIKRQNQLIRLANPLVPKWKAGNPYNVGDYTSFNDVIYVARTKHDASNDFEADHQAALWTVDLTGQASLHNAILNIRDNDTRWVSKPLKFEDLVIDDAKEFNSLPDAGYIRVDEADYNAPNFEAFGVFAEAAIRSSQEFEPGDNIWVYERGFEGWSVDYIEHPSNALTASNLVSENLTDTSGWVQRVQSAYDKFMAPFTGLTWKFGCLEDSDPFNCACDPDTPKSFKFGGDPDVVYTAKFRVRGVVELATYTGGEQLTPSFAYKNASDAVHPPTYDIPPNQYKIIVSNPHAEYFLNNGTFSRLDAVSLDYVVEIPVNGGATVTIFGDDIDGYQIKNLGNHVLADDLVSRPITVPQPFNGQFIQIDGILDSDSLAATPSFSFATAASPDIFADARSVAYVDGGNVTAKAGTYLNSAPITVIPGEAYSMRLETYQTKDFNGAIYVHPIWLKEDGSPSDAEIVDIGLLDHRSSKKVTSSKYEGLFGLTLVPSDATSVILRISVEFDPANPATGKIYITGPEFKYAGIGVRVVKVDNHDSDEDVTGTRFTLNMDHNLEEGDYVLIGGPILQSYSAVGVFQVQNFDTDWFEIDLEADTIQPFDFTENDDVGPPVYSLVKGRFANKADAVAGFHMNGKLVYIDDNDDGRWAVYKAPDYNFVVRQQPNIIDSTKIASSLIYDKHTKIGTEFIQPEPKTVDSINPVDPMVGVLIGAADQEIDYKLEYDPAGYGDDEGRWTDDYIGRVWWDMSTTWFINPYTDILTEDDPRRYLREIQYRTSNWARLAPGVSIDLYEWTKTRTNPADFVGDRFTSGEYVTSTEFDPFLGREVEVYYFWVKNPSTLPSVDFRKENCQACASILSNPSLAGIPWMAIISDKEMIYSSIHDFINDESTVIQTVLQLTDWDEDLPHVQWQIVRTNDSQSQPNQILWDKMGESLVGFNHNLKSVPNKTLHAAAQTGIGIGQGMFDAKYVKLARETFITMINYQLARVNYGSDHSFGDEMLNFEHTLPPYLHWTSVPGDRTLAILPPPAFYDTVTTDPAEVTTIFANEAIPDGYRVLLDNRFGDTPSWTVWQKSGEDVVLAPSYDHIVEDRAGLINIAPLNGDLIYVQSDSVFNDFWSVLRFSNVLGEDQLTVVWTKTYDTSDFWEYADWYADGFDVNSPPMVTYATIGARNQAEIPFPTNQFVKILDNGSGYWVWTAYIGGSWTTVAQQSATIQLTEKFFTNTVTYGWSATTETYEFDPAKVEKRDGTFELRVLFNALLSNNLLLDAADKNELWFAMVNFVHAHHDHVDWAFKTSFMSVVGYNEQLLPTPVAHPDNMKNIISYVEEVKPYHVTIRDIQRNLAVLEPLNLVVTDFDKPLYYDPILQKYRTLDLNNSDDVAIMEGGVWHHWLHNMDKARRFRITMVLDRVWFEDENDSGAARRIMSFYNPGPSMKPKDLRVLLELDFKGTILEGKGFEDELTEVTTATGDEDLPPVNGYLDDGREGNLMRDPRVAENSPQELVRLGAHDVLLCRAHDKWGAGGPLSTINTYDVERETAATISLRIDALARDIMVFFDGIRGFEGVDYTFNQFGNTIENALLVRGGKRVSTITIHTFGYAGHTTLIDQVLFTAPDDDFFDIEIPATVLAETDYSCEVTANGKYIDSQLNVGFVRLSAHENDQIVVSFYKTTEANTTRLIDTILPSQPNPNGNINNISAPVAIFNTSGTPLVAFDMIKKRVFSADVDGSPSLAIRDFDATTLYNNASSDYVFKDIIPGTDWVITQDNATISGGSNPRHRALQIRSVQNMVPITIIGQNGEYSTSTATMTGTDSSTKIPSDVSIVGLFNPRTNVQAFLVARAGEARFYSPSGDLLHEGDIGWGTGSFVISCTEDDNYLTIIVVNPASSDKPFVRIKIGYGTDISIFSFVFAGLAALGTMSVVSGVYNAQDGSVILFASRSGGGQAVIKYSLSSSYIMWTTWSDYSGQAARFSLPTGTTVSRLIGQHLLWASDMGIHDINIVDGAFANVASTTSVTALDKQAWDERSGTLMVFRSAANEVSRYTITFSDAPFQATFQLDEVSLNRPYMSSMIVEVNGRRLAPPHMMHIMSTAEYFLGEDMDPSQIKIMDYNGQIAGVQGFADDAFQYIDDIYTSGTTARYVYWRQNIVILDTDATSHDYVLFLNGTGEFFIDDNTKQLTINDLRTNDEVRVLHWRNDAIMDPQTWSFKARASGTYRIITRGRPATTCLSINGLRMVEDVDYTVLPSTAGAWDVEAFDTFRYDDQTEVDIAIKDTLRGHENDLIVIMAFEGPQATPAIDWQMCTTTPSLYRFNKRPDEDIKEGEGSFSREKLAWEVSTSDLLREGGVLNEDMPSTEDVATFTITLNAFDAPSEIQAENPVMIPDATSLEAGVIWIEEERFEYFKRVISGNTVTFSELRRGTRGTPKLPHIAGEFATVQYLRWRIPELPHLDLPIPPTSHGPDTPDEPTPPDTGPRDGSITSGIAISANATGSYFQPDDGQIQASVTISAAIAVTYTSPPPATTLRGSTFFQNSFTPTIVIGLPSGAAIGDTAVMMVAAGDGVSSFNPTGWSTLQSNSPANGWNCAIYTKTLNSTDITAGNVTLSMTGNFQKDVVLWCFNGAATVQGQMIGSSMTSGNVNGHTFSFGASIPAGAIVLMAATGRGNSVPTITPGTLAFTDSQGNGSLSAYNYTMPSAGTGSFIPNSISSAYEYVFMAVALT